MSAETLAYALAAKSRHFSPFFMLGDPDPGCSVELACAAERSGATMLELGIPFSDPCADGPAIQAACLRARRSGVSTGAAFEILAEISHRLPHLPRNLLVYGNLVHARGPDRFCAEAAQAGASSLLVPDMPLEEAGALRAACEQAGIAYVPLVGPATDDDRVHELDAASTGFIYLAAYQGVTGGEDPACRTRLVERVAKLAKRPLCLGFGLSRPEHLHEVYLAGARIAVVGSHLARLIAGATSKHAGDQREIVRIITGACRELAGAASTRNSTEKNHAGHHAS